MAIKNPSSEDFKNTQKRAIDYQDLYLPSDVLRAVSYFFKNIYFESANDEPLYYITSGLNTTAIVTNDKIQITVSKGSAIIDNQPIVFLDDFIFEYDKPDKDTTYYLYIHYKYVEEYPPNYAVIENYLSPIDNEEYFLLAQVDYKINSNTVNVRDFAIKSLFNLNKILLEKIKTVDGKGSGLDADLVNGYKLLATINEDGSFNNDGIFKIKEINGSKFLVGVLDANLYTKSIPITFDIFNDGSCVALYEFENNLLDTGGVYNGIGFNIRYCDGVIGRAVQSDIYGSYINVNNLPFDRDTEVVSISAWIKWNGTNRAMPFGWYNYIIQFEDGNLGFTTYNNDLYGISSSGFVNTWKHIVVEFRKGEYGKIWVDGISQTLSQIQGSIITEFAYMTSEFYILGYGWGGVVGGEGYGWGYDFGCIDHLRIFNRSLTDDEVKILYNEGRQQ